MQSILFLYQRINIPFIGDSHNQNTSAAFIYLWESASGTTKLKN